MGLCANPGVRPCLLGGFEGSWTAPEVGSGIRSRQGKEAIGNKLGWEEPAAQASSSWTDCRPHEIVNYPSMKPTSCSMDGMGFCNMIIAGQMEREEALREEELIIKTCGDHIDELLTMVGLNAKEAALIKAMRSPIGIAQ